MRYIKIDHWFFSSVLMLAIFGLFNVNSVPVMKYSGPIVIVGGGGDLEYKLTSAFDKIEREIPRVRFLAENGFINTYAEFLDDLYLYERILGGTDNVKFNYTAESTTDLMVDQNQITVNFNQVEPGLSDAKEQDFRAFWFEGLLIYVAQRLSDYENFLNTYNYAVDKVMATSVETNYDGHPVTIYVSPNDAKNKSIIVVVGATVYSLVDKVEEILQCGGEYSYQVLSQQLRSEPDSLKLVLSVQFMCEGSTSFTSMEFTIL